MALPAQLRNSPRARSTTDACVPPTAVVVRLHCHFVRHPGQVVARGLVLCKALLGAEAAPDVQPAGGQACGVGNMNDRTESIAYT